MRGRTNADAGLQLNATTDTYEVANGESIIAGDFVQRIISVSGETTIDALHGYALRASARSIARFENNKFLDRVYSSSSAWSIRDVKLSKSSLGELTQIGSSEVATPLMGGDQDTLFVELSDNTIATFRIGIDIVKNTTSTTPYLITTFEKYTSDDTISTRTVETPLTVSLTHISFNSNKSIKSNPQVIKKSNGGYKVFYGAQLERTSASDNYYSYIVSFDLSINGSTYSSYTPAVSNEQKVLDTFGSERTYFTWATEIANNQFAYAYYKRSGTTTFNDYTVVNPISNTTYRYDSVQSSDYWIMNTISANRNINLIRAISSGNNGTVVRRRLYCGDNEVVSYPDETIFAYTNDCHDVKYLGTDNVNDIYVYLTQNNNSSNAQMGIFLINRSTQELTVNETILLDSVGSRLVVSSLLNNNVIIGFRNTVMSYTYSNGVLTSDRTTIKQVKNANSQTYIMGVAKQSGSAGDTIEVYIPQVSN